MAMEPEYFDFLGMQSKKTLDSKSLKRKSTFSPFSRSDHVSKFCTAKKKKTSAPGAAMKVQTKVTTFFNVDGEQTNSGKGEKNDIGIGHDRIPVKPKNAAIVKRTLVTAQTMSPATNVQDSSPYCVTTPARLVKSLANIATKKNPISEPTADLNAFRRQVIEKAQQALLQMHSTKDSSANENLPIHIEHLSTVKTSGRTKKSAIPSKDLPLHTDPEVETVKPVHVSQIVHEIHDSDSNDQTQLVPSNQIAVSTTEVNSVQTSATDGIEGTLAFKDIDVDEIVECVQPSDTHAIGKTCLSPRDSDVVEMGNTVTPKDSETIASISSTTELAQESESGGTNRHEVVEQSDDWSDIAVTNVYLECSVSLEQQDDVIETVDDNDEVLLEDDSPGVDDSISVINCDQQDEATETVNDADDVLVEDDSPSVDHSRSVRNSDQQDETNDSEDDSSGYQQTSNIETQSCNSVPLYENPQSHEFQGDTSLSESHQASSVEIPSYVPLYENVELPQSQECPLLQPNVVTENVGLMQVYSVPASQPLPDSNVSPIQPQMHSEASLVDENEVVASTSSNHEVGVYSNLSTVLENTRPTAKHKRQSSDSPQQKKSTESPHKTVAAKKWKALKLKNAETTGESTANSNLSSGNPSDSNEQENSSWDKSAAQFKLGLALDLELENIFSIHGSTSNDESLNVSQSNPCDLGEEDNVKLSGRPDIQDPNSETSPCPAQETTKGITSELESTAKSSSSDERLKPKSYPNIIPLNIYLKFYNWYNNEWKAKDVDQANIENSEPVCSCACSLCDCVCHCKEQETKKLLEESQSALVEFFSGVEEWMQSSDRKMSDAVHGKPDDQKPKVAKEQKKNPLSIKTRKRNVIPELLFQGLPEKRPIKPPTWHSTYLDVPLRSNNEIPSIDIMDCNPSAYRRSCTIVNEKQLEKQNLLEAYKTVHSVFNPLKEISNNVAPVCKTPRKVTRKENAASQNNAPIQKKAKKPKLRFYSYFSKKRRRKSPPIPKQNGSSSTKRGEEAGSSTNVPQNVHEPLMADNTQEVVRSFPELEPEGQDDSLTLQMSDNENVAQSLEVEESHLDFSAHHQEQEENVELQPTLLADQSINSTARERISNTNSSHKNLDKPKRVSKNQSKKQTSNTPQNTTSNALNLNPDERVGQSLAEFQPRLKRTVTRRCVPITNRMIEFAPQRPNVTRVHVYEPENHALSTQPLDAKTIVNAIQHNRFQGGTFAASKFSNILSVLNLNVGGESAAKSSIEEVYKEDDHDVESVRQPLDEIQYQVDCAILRDSLDEGIRRPDEESIIRRLFFAQKDYLKKIMTGKIACARHKEFSHSTVSSENMPDFSVMIFRERTLTALLNLMTQELNDPDLKSFHYEKRSLFRCYYWNVLVPELIIKIFMDAYGISKSEAHRKIISFQCNFKFETEMFKFLE